MFSFILDYFPLKKEIIVSDKCRKTNEYLMAVKSCVPLIWTELFLCLYFPCGSAGKESACNVRDLDSIPGLGRSLGYGKGYPLQYPGLENSPVYAVAKSWTQLNNFHFHRTVKSQDNRPQW